MNAEKVAVPEGRKALGNSERSASVIAPGALRSSHLVKITQDVVTSRPRT